MKDGILFSKGRIVGGMNFVKTVGLELADLGPLERTLLMEIILKRLIRLLFA